MIKFEGKNKTAMSVGAYLTSEVRVDAMLESTGKNFESKESFQLDVMGMEYDIIKNTPEDNGKTKRDCVFHITITEDFSFDGYRFNFKTETSEDPEFPVDYANACINFLMVELGIAYDKAKKMVRDDSVAYHGKKFAESLTADERQCVVNPTDNRVVEVKVYGKATIDCAVTNLVLEKMGLSPNNN